MTRFVVTGDNKGVLDENELVEMLWEVEMIIVFVEVVLGCFAVVVLAFEVDVMTTFVDETELVAALLEEMILSVDEVESAFVVLPVFVIVDVVTFVLVVAIAVVVVVVVVVFAVFVVVVSEVVAGEKYLLLS